MLEITKQFQDYTPLSGGDALKEDVVDFPTSTRKHMHALCWSEPSTKQFFTTCSQFEWEKNNVDIDVGTFVMSI